MPTHNSIQGDLSGEERRSELHSVVMYRAITKHGRLINLKSQLNTTLHRIVTNA